MSLITSKETTGLRICFLPDFNFPQIAYYYRTGDGTPYLSIDERFQNNAPLVWQLKFMSGGITRHAEARFYLGRDGSITCSYPPPTS